MAGRHAQTTEHQSPVVAARYSDPEATLPAQRNPTAGECAVVFFREAERQRALIGGDTIDHPISFRPGATPTVTSLPDPAPFDLHPDRSASNRPEDQPRTLREFWERLPESRDLKAKLFVSLCSFTVFVALAVASVFYS
jgi:hypothetical protein